MPRDDFNELGSTVSHNDSLGWLIDEITDKTGKGILGNRVVQDQIVNLILEMSEDRFRREIEIIQVGVINETMAIVSAMLTGLTGPLAQRRSLHLAVSWISPFVPV